MAVRAGSFAEREGSTCWSTVSGISDLRATGGFDVWKHVAGDWWLHGFRVRFFVSMGYCEYVLWIFVDVSGALA